MKILWIVSVGFGFDDNLGIIVVARTIIPVSHWLSWNTWANSSGKTITTLKTCRRLCYQTNHPCHWNHFKFKAFSRSKYMQVKLIEDWSDNCPKWTLKNVRSSKTSSPIPVYTIRHGIHSKIGISNLFLCVFVFEPIFACTTTILLSQIAIVKTFHISIFI